MGALIAEFLRWAWRDVRRQVSTVLAIVWLVSLVRFPDSQHIIIPLTVVGIGAALDVLISRLRGNWRFPSAAGVTSWLVALILDPTNGLAPMIVAVVLALASKYTLRLRHHWFNPAAFGIVGSSLLFHVPVAWWAVSWSWIPAAILLVGMTPILNRLKRLWLPVIFFIVYTLWLAFVGRDVSVIGRALIDGTVLLFAFVMLPEPMTSPAHGRWKYGFALLVAGLVILFGSFRSFQLPDLLLTALLLGNFIAVIVRALRRDK